MKNEFNQKLKWIKVLSILTMALGALLLLYMIKVEDEPGAIPLLLIFIGTVGLMVTKLQIRRHHKLKKTVR